MSKKNLEEVLRDFRGLVTEMRKRYQVQVDKPDLGLVLDEIDRLRAEVARLKGAAP